MTLKKVHPVKNNLMEATTENRNNPKRCFVVMGFGIKTDFATGRKIDLNKSYKYLIKPVVESKGLICIRADEIVTTGSIDYQMYQELFNADIVIADLSTANVNAFYELGIRHALRRRTTIVISEDKLAYPFDLNHIKITSYTHLGGAIDYEEVLRFNKVLGETIDSVLKIEEPDSPVYSFLPELSQPSVELKPANPVNQGNEVLKTMADNSENQKTSGNDQDKRTLGVLIEEGEAALHDREYANAKAFFDTAMKMKKVEANNNPYLIQRLAFATYKAKMPDVISALNDSIKLLSQLDLEHTNDTETVSLAGRIEKKLFEKGQGDTHLVNAIQFYERGYVLFQNRYHGNNLAFLLDKRADSSIYNTDADKIADMIWANRIRRQVLKMCENEWNEIHDRKDRQALKMSVGDASKHADYDEADDEADDNVQMFWILVNKAEAHYGLGEMEEYKKAIEAAKEVKHEEWMFKAFNDQHIELHDVMKKHGHLLNPAWIGDE